MCHPPWAKVGGSRIRLENNADASFQSFAMRRLLFYRIEQGTGWSISRLTEIARQRYCYL